MVVGIWSGRVVCIALEGRFLQINVRSIIVISSIADEGREEGGRKVVVDDLDCMKSSRPNPERM